VEVSAFVELASAEVVFAFVELASAEVASAFVVGTELAFEEEYSVVVQ
jgi:hypothetical protein